MKLLELTLHEHGYSYVGDNNLYQLTWIEVFRIIEANNIRQSIQSKIADSMSPDNRGGGRVRESDIRGFRQFQSNLDT